MGTSLSEVYDVFMMTITDYRLIDLFNTSVPDFENYLQSWLDFAIVDFKVCDQNLNYDDTINEFPADLSRDNKVVLATLMMRYWLQKAVNDVTQFNLHITDRDFKIASEAQNLREKVNHLNIVKEQCSQLLQEYAYNKNSWVNWYAQDYGG